MCKKWIVLLAIGVISFLSLATAETAKAQVADHTVVDAFPTPPNYLPKDQVDSAKAKRALFMHQSTGGYIFGEGLGCLAGRMGNDPDDPTECASYRNYSPYAFNYFKVPTVPDNEYVADNWLWPIWYNAYGGPQADSMAKTDQFVTTVQAMGNNFDVIGMKYCYVDGWNQDENVSWTSPDPTRPTGYYINKMLDLEAQYPNKTFIWATSALWYNPGTACNSIFNSCAEIASFNQQVRTYALAHNKPMFDIADIESHDSNGNSCYVMDSSGFPHEGLCSQYYGDGGGHPNKLGNLRLAKGFWWLMANLGSSPNPTPTPTPTGTPNPTATPTPTPTPTEVVDPADIATLPSGTNVLIDFNNFTNPSDGRAMPTNYSGIAWSYSLVEGSPWAGIITWNFYILNSSQGILTFPRPVLVKSVRVSSAGSNQFTLISTGNPNVSLTTSNNSPRTLTTGWSNMVTSLTVHSSTSDNAFDDLRLTMGN